MSVTHVDVSKNLLAVTPRTQDALLGMQVDEVPRKAIRQSRLPSSKPSSLYATAAASASLGRVSAKNMTSSAAKQLSGLTLSMINLKTKLNEEFSAEMAAAKKV